MLATKLETINKIFISGVAKTKGWLKNLLTDHPSLLIINLTNSILQKLQLFDGNQTNDFIRELLQEDIYSIRFEQLEEISKVINYNLV